MGAIPTALTAASLLTTPFCERYPHVRVLLTSLSSREIARRLADFEIDMAMTYLDDEEDLGDVRSSPLYEERYLLLTPSDGEPAECFRVLHDGYCMLYTKWRRCAHQEGSG